MKLLFILEKFFQFILPRSVRLQLSGIRIYIYDFFGLVAKPYYQYISYKYKKKTGKYKGKQTINVAFFVFQDAIWKYDAIFKQMQASPNFNPAVVVIPYINYGNSNMLNEMEKTYKTFVQKGYNTVKTFDKTTKTWLDVKKHLKPDIIFFSSPYRLTKPQYLINHYTGCLTAYIPYGIMSSNIQQDQFNQMFHNLVWRCYYETPIHKEMAKKYACNKGINVTVSGYPMCDVFIDKKHKAVDVWKHNTTQAKRIIWAPHHTLEADSKLYGYSNFLQYSDFMLSILETYKGQIQIAFKPHPILKLKLYNRPEWGKQKTDKYFEQWSNHPFGQLEEGDYNDLFITSDSLIHDSISFISEYCYTGKPSLFMLRDNKVKTMFNEFGRAALELSYFSKTTEDIINFIEHVVLKSIDPKQPQRGDFVENVLTPPGNKPATQFIIEDLLNTLQLAN